VEDLGTIAIKARSDPVGLADRIFTALSANDYGVFDGLVAAMVPALGAAGTARLKSRLVLALAEARGRDRRASAVRRALQDIADSQVDIDAYIALVPLEDRSRPHTGAEIGRRLLAAGRATEALVALENARPKQRPGQADLYDDFYPAGHGDGGAWEEIYIEALDATGQEEQAQRLRWAAFEERLSSTQLRAYLKKLPDFEDVEAEERAMRHVLGFRSFPVALNFLRGWLDQARAAQLVLARATEIDGNLSYLLEPAAQLIEGRHPLAATLLRRAMIEDTLDGAKSARYKHAARHLLECLTLASSIQDFGAFETHETFASRLHTKHGRKVGFWGKVAELSEIRR
jgi:hypothetical protein